MIINEITNAVFASVFKLFIDIAVILVGNKESWAFLSIKLLSCQHLDLLDGLIHVVNAPAYSSIFKSKREVENKSQTEIC